MMRRTIWLLILLASTLILAAYCTPQRPAPAAAAPVAVAPAPAPAPAVIAALRRSVMLVYQDGTCSGVIVGPRAILTAAHCHEIGNPLKADGRFITVQEAVEDGADHILYRTAENFAHWAAPAPFPLVGDRVFIVGHPMGWPAMYRVGYLSGFVGTDALWDMRGWRGDSGGGIFNDKGELVGIVTQIVGDSPFFLMVSKPLQFEPDDWARMTQ